MTPLDALMSIPGSTAVDALAAALLHFVWQGAALGLAAWLVMRALSAASARYVVGVAALGLMAIVAAGTFVSRARTVSAGEIAPAVAAGVPSPADAAGEMATAAIGPAGSASARVDLGPLVVLVWLAGVAVLSVRLAGGFVVVRRLRRRGTETASAAVQAMVARFARRVGLAGAVRVLSSPAVSAPVLVGWLKPVILLPAAAMSGLSTAQLEALIAHELAHVKRHDYLVNLLQSAVETLLFYHPAVWWLSREIRREREHCCDDLAVTVCDRVIYASALTDLAAMVPAPRFALGAADGPLLARVRRILEGAARERGTSARAAGPILALLIVALVPAGVALTRAPEQATADTPRAGSPAAAGRRAPGARASTFPTAAPTTGPQEPSAAPAAEAPASTGNSNALRVQLRELEQALERLEDERHRLEAERVKAEESGRRQTLERQIAELRGQLKRLDGVPAGADREVMASQTRAELAAVELELRRLDTEAEYRARAAALEAEERQNRRRHELLMREVERETLERERELSRQIEVEGRLQLQAEADAQALALPLIELELEPTLEEKVRVTRERFEEINRRLQTIAVPMHPVAPAGSTAQAGDVLMVDVDGEPNLPRVYVVRADASIAFPLVGSIRVVGLTPAQVGEAITKELADRRLAVGRRVTATLHRPR
jgi:beta-lactamase regulating signal transducer with metallopeptidase domain